VKFVWGTAAALLLICLIAPAAALAHANLTACSIKNHAVYSVAKAPKTVSATFAEELTPGKSWMSVFEGSGDHGLVNEQTKSVVDYRSPKHMTLKLPTLRNGAYYLVWYTVSAVDGHVAAGVVYFRVK
jgi:methionine-rich copper-binding protein CopC